MAPLPWSGTVVIGEGEKDEAPMLYRGERVGSAAGPEYDIAVDRSTVRRSRQGPAGCCGGARGEPTRDHARSEDATVSAGIVTDPHSCILAAGPLPSTARRVACRTAAASPHRSRRLRGRVTASEGRPVQRT